MSSITAALLVFTAVAGLADWLGWGHGYDGLLLLWLFFLAARSERGWRWTRAVMLAGSVAIAVLAVTQVFFMPRARGIWGSPNFLGWYALCHIFLAISLRNRWSLPLAAVNLVSLGLSQSRGSILGLGIGFAVMVAWKRPWWAAMALLGAGDTALLIRPGLDEQRLLIWRFGWQVARSRLLLGYGHDGIAVSGLTVFYNLPLDLLLSFGILGIATAAWVAAAAWRAASSRPELRGFLAAWVANGMVFFATPSSLVPLFLVLGWLSIRRDEPRKAVLVKHDEPFLYGRMRAGGAE